MVDVALLAFYSECFGDGCNKNKNENGDYVVQVREYKIIHVYLF